MPFFSGVTALDGCFGFIHFFHAFFPWASLEDWASRPSVFLLQLFLELPAKQFD